jgi:hypothetical protein
LAPRRWRAGQESRGERRIGPVLGGGDRARSGRNGRASRPQSKIQVLPRRTEISLPGPGPLVTQKYKLVLRYHQDAPGQKITGPAGLRPKPDHGPGHHLRRQLRLTGSAGGPTERRLIGPFSLPRPPAFSSSQRFFSEVRQNPDGGKILGLAEDFSAGNPFLPQRSIS